MKSPVLVVEDDNGIRTLVAEVLADAGYTIVRAASARQAREALAAPPAAAFGLVLSDSLGPRSTAPSGWLSELRTLTRTPIVITSAWARAAYADYKEHGFAAVLPKPFDLDDLIAVVAAHYDHAGMAAPPVQE